MNLSSKAIKWIIAGVILLVLVVTVPSKEAHVKALTDELVEAMYKVDMGKEAAMAKALGPGLVNKALQGELEVSNYGILSVGRVKDGSGSKTVSLGILGHVFTFGVDEDALRKGLK